jgi:hypothetical protein
MNAGYFKENQANKQAIKMRWGKDKKSEGSTFVYREERGEVVINGGDKDRTRVRDSAKSRKRKVTRCGRKES